MPKVALVVLLFLPLSVYAITFSNQYLSFELPRNWQCKDEGTIWKCNSHLKEERDQANIVLSVKTADATDNLENYLQLLKKSRLLNGKDRKAAPSQVVRTERRFILGHEWIDSMHLGSEIPDYYSGYLATVKNRNRILIILNAHKLNYAKYSRDFFTLAESLSLNEAKLPSAQGPQEQMGTVDGDPFLTNIAAPPEPKRAFPMRMLIAFSLIGSAAGFYWWSRKKS